MYAIELFVGRGLDRFVRDSWQALKDLHISSALPDIEGIRPHITVAVIEEIVDVDSFCDKLEEHMAEQPIVPITIDSLAVFPASGTVYVAPAMNNQLYALHRGFYKHFAEHHKASLAYYRPDRWNPHCSLGIHLTKIQMTRALACCLNHFKPMQSTIESIGLVKLLYEEGKCVSVKPLKEIFFKENDQEQVHL